MLECKNYIPINKGSCLGIANIFVPKWGAKISGISLHQKNGKRWVNMPSRCVEEEGEKKYYPYISFENKEHKDKFCEMVKDAIDRHAQQERTQVIEQGESPF